MPWNCTGGFKTKKRTRTSIRSIVLPCLAILLIWLTIVAPNVQAQPSGITSIINVQYPSQAVLQNGVAQVEVTFTVYYNQYYNPQGYLVFGIFDTSSSNFVTGSATASPVPCQSLAGTSYADSALCATVPSSSSGTESASFTLTLDVPQQYSLRAVAFAWDSTNLNSGNVIIGSRSSATVTITVTGPTVSATITNLQSPAHAVLKNGVAQAAVTFTVGYSSLPSGFGVYAGVIYAGTTNYVTGSATSTPDSCQSMAGTSFGNLAVCSIMPSSSFGTESVSFSLTFNSTQQYALGADGAIVDKSGNIVSGSVSGMPFTISVTDKLQLNVTVPSSVTVTVDGTNQAPGAASILLQLGNHTISVPQTIPLTSGSQLRFDHWSDGSNLANRTDDLEDDTNLTATYVTQHSLTLTEPSATGAGWYDQGSTAQFSAPSSEPVPGILGILGGTQTLQGWYENGTLVTSSSTGSITMNAPHALSVQWTTNYTMPLAVIIIVVVVAGVLVFFVTRRRSTKGKQIGLRIGEPRTET